MANSLQIFIIVVMETCLRKSLSRPFRVQHFPKLSVSLVLHAIESPRCRRSHCRSDAQVRKLLDVKPSRPISADVVGRYMSEATDLDLYINRTDLPSELVKSMDNCIPFDWHSEDLIPMIAMSAIDRVLYDYRYPFDLRYEYLVCDNKSNGYQWGFSYWMMLVFASLHGTLSLFFLHSVHGALCIDIKHRWLDLGHVCHLDSHSAKKLRKDQPYEPKTWTLSRPARPI